MCRFKELFRINECSGYASGQCLARRMIDRHYTGWVIVYAYVCDIHLGLDKKWIFVDMLRLFVILFVCGLHCGRILYRVC